MQGAFFFACSNISRTRAAPTPTNISTKSEPDIEKNGTFASPAIAFASKVLPVPGGPTISTPRGMCPPSFWNFEGSRRNSTSSWTSSFASSQPATSAKVMLLLFSSISLAFDLPNENAPPLPPPCIWRIKNTQTPIRSSIGNQDTKILMSKEGSSSAFAETRTPNFMRSETIQRSWGVLTVIWRSSEVSARTVRPSTEADLIRPCRASSMNWEYGISGPRA